MTSNLIHRDKMVISYHKHRFQNERIRAKLTFVSLTLVLVITSNYLLQKQFLVQSVAQVWSRECPGELLLLATGPVPGPWQLLYCRPSSCIEMIIIDTEYLTAPGR